MISCQLDHLQRPYFQIRSPSRFQGLGLQNISLGDTVQSSTKSQYGAYTGSALGGPQGARGHRAGPRGGSCETGHTEHGPGTRGPLALRLAVACSFRSHSTPLRLPPRCPRCCPAERVCWTPEPLPQAAWG